MSLLVFLVACGIGASVVLADRPEGRIGRLFGPAALLVAFLAALGIGPTTSLVLGGVTLSGSQYSGLFLACAAGSGFLLSAVGLASGRPDELPPAALASFAGLAVAITAADPSVALGGAAAAATTGALVILRADPRRPEEDGRLAESRTIGLVAVSLLVASVAVLRPAWAATTDQPVFVLAFLGLGLALAVRSGVVPFHVPAARMGRSAAPHAPALLLVWVPAGIGLLAISWSAATFGIDSSWLDAAVSLIQVVGVATLVLGGLAALVNDDLEEVAAYSIVADAGFVLLALAARTDAVTEPARLWLLVFVAAKSGLVAWTVATSRIFGTSSVPGLQGWLRRAPILGVALVVIALATLGWPDSAVWNARSTIIKLALPGQLQFLFVAAILLSLACWGRLLAIGLASPTTLVQAARSELPRLTSDSSRATASNSTTDGISAELQPPAITAGAPGARLGNKASVSAAVELEPESAAAGGLPAALERSTASASSTADTPEPANSAAAPTGPSLRDTLAIAWRLNRTLEVSLILVVGAVLALALAFGNLGAADASRFGIPMDSAARSTPTARIQPTPVSTSTPLPTPGPPATPGPSISVGPSGSALPSTSAPPVKTSAPGKPDSG